MDTNGTIWKKRTSNENYTEAEKQTDNFFETFNGIKGLEYREGQSKMALDIIDAMKNKEILLIEAGVGIGKSYAYIIPILYSVKNTKNFKGFIISTSTIALQEQLKKDVEAVSQMLEIPIEVAIAKGRNNYICRRRLEEFLNASEENNQKYHYILEQLSEGKIEDRNNFDEIKPQIWEKIKITSCNSTYCTQCCNCQYVINKNSWANSQAIICNHDFLIDSLKNQESKRLIKNPSVLIIDEAHNLESKVANAYQQTLNKKKIESLIYKVYEDLTLDTQITCFNSDILISLNSLFRKINNKAKGEFQALKRKDIEYQDMEKCGFNFSLSIEKELNNFLKHINILLDSKKRYEKFCNVEYHSKAFEELIEVIEVLKDMSKKENSKNNYWVELEDCSKEHVRIMYQPKNIAQLTANLLKNPNYAKVLTSATLTTDNDNYDYFSKSTGIDTITGIKTLKEFPIPSPYNYNQNTLVYLDTTTISPKDKNHTKYINSLTCSIEKLLEATDGKALVLFTSKKDMYETYQKIIERGNPYYIILQEEGKSAENIKKEFENDENSVLFATGAFWEGIDIKGRSLSNVIITKLPFAVVDPIIKEKEKHVANPFTDIYLPDMLIKLKQGTGRLIRSSTDTGIIAILDSRVIEYENNFSNIITKNIPCQNITTNIKDVKKFAIEKNIKNENSNAQKTIKY